MAFPTISFTINNCALNRDLENTERDKNIERGRDK